MSCSTLFRVVLPCAAALATAALFLSTGTQLHAVEQDSVTEGPDAELYKIITARRLKGDPAIGVELPKITDPLAQLGMKLFFSTQLSGTNDTACATCHHPYLGGGDALSLPRGVNAANVNVLGPGRVLQKEGAEGPILSRNAPTIFNVALFDSVLLWDGRIESFGKTKGKNGGDGMGIRTPDTRHETVDPNAGANMVEAQAKEPVVSPVEMKGADNPQDVGYADRTARQGIRDEIAARVQKNEGWKAEFKRLFGDTTITYDRMAHAMGEYQRSQIFTNTPWKAYVKGDQKAISERAKNGALLFFKPVSQGGADCASCHRGDFFTDEKFHVIGIPQVGRGMADGDTADDDYGRYRETKHRLEKFAFRTPTLLNVEVTAPYGHTGAYHELRDVVRHHVQIDKSLREYDGSRIEPTILVPNMAKYRKKVLEQIEELKKEGVKTAPQIALSEEQIGDLVEFLKTLTDPCVKDAGCLAPWIPDPKKDDPDGVLKLLHAVGADGKPLAKVIYLGAPS